MVRSSLSYIFVCLVIQDTDTTWINPPVPIPIISIPRFNPRTGEGRGHVARDGAREDHAARQPLL